MVQELLNRLHCFVLRPAATVNRLIDPEEDEVSDDIDTDELMRSMGPKNMIAPRYRWRRSRWLRFCPVALSEGNIVQGKAEFTVRSVSRRAFDDTCRFVVHLHLFLNGISISVNVAIRRLVRRLAPI